MFRFVTIKKQQFRRVVRTIDEQLIFHFYFIRFNFQFEHVFDIETECLKKIITKFQKNLAVSEGINSKQKGVIYQLFSLLHV